MTTGNIHIVTQGDSWEVRREGDSKPLGTYFTEGEAEEKARAQAALDGVEVVLHGEHGDEIAREEPPPPGG